jgi:hypothetical protein
LIERAHPVPVDYFSLTMVSATLISELDVVSLGADRPEATFGRSPEADLQIGHRPHLDRGIANRAGRMWCSGGEILVQNLHQHVALRVHPEGHVPVWLGPKQVFGPATERFDVYLPGEKSAVETDAVVEHVILVTRAPAEEPPRTVATVATNPPRPELSDRQREILDAVVRPLREGHPDPLSYARAAGLVNWSEQLVRAEMTQIWREFRRAGVPMLSHSQKSRAVIDAWLNHRVRP